MLAPGRLRLATKPPLTGSTPIANTIGMVVVADLAARAAAVPFAIIMRLAGAPGPRPAPATDQSRLPPTEIRARRCGPRHIRFQRDRRGTLPQGRRSGYRRD